MDSMALDVRGRTKQFALRILALYSALPDEAAARIIGKQLVRSAGSCGAHCREGKHSRSAAELFSKLSVALQEMEESRYWIEMLGEAGIVKMGRLEGLLREADELVALLFASTRTLKRRLR